MKKVIAITSFLFMFLVAVLPQQVAQAASNYSATITISGKDYKINSNNNNIVVNIDDLVNQNNLKETDKVEKISLVTKDGAKTITLAGTISILFPTAKINVETNKVDIVVADRLGALDPQQDGVAISTVREFLYPVNNQVSGQATVDYGTSKETLNFVLKATKQLNLTKGTTPVNVNDLTLTASGKEFKATKTGTNKFNLNLAGADAFDFLESVKLTSDTATTVSVFARSSAFYSDLTDVKFLNKEANLNQEKIANWGTKLGISIPTSALAIGAVKILLKETGITTLNGVVADAAGNESPFSVTIQTSGWAQVNNHWYLFDKNGAKLTGWQLDGGKWYYLGTDGIMKTDWQYIGGKWYYLNTTTGAMETNQVNTNGKLYVLDQSGAMLTGTGWVKSGNKWYFLEKGDTAKTGWVKSGNKWFYLNSTSGVMQTGWAKVNGTWYSLNAKGEMTTGWAKVNNKWYFFNASGAMKTGWVKDKGTWYFLNSNGDMATGWAYTANKWYYLNGSGAMKTGWVLVSNKWYYLYSDGHMASNTKIGSYKLGKDGAWIK